MLLNYTSSVESVRKSSPCRVKWFGKREKVRPARQKWLDFGVFGLAGRVFSRFGRGWAAAGRTYSRFGQDGAVVGRVLSRFGLDRAAAGRVLSRFGQDGAVVGRVFSWFCLEMADAGRTLSRGNDWRGLRGEFCLGLVVGGVLLGEFCLARALASSLVNRPERRQHPTQATAQAGDATRPHTATPPAA